MEKEGRLYIGSNFVPNWWVESDVVIVVAYADRRLMVFNDACALVDSSWRFSEVLYCGPCCAADLSGGFHKRFEVALSAVRVRLLS